MSDATPESLCLAELWLQHKDRLLTLLTMKMPRVLQRRLSPEDLLQETYLACGQRMDFLKAEPEVPVFVKLRRIALQTLADQQRRHLAAGKRDIYKENTLDDSDSAMDAWAQFADTISNPRSHMLKLERQALARKVLTELPANDREILELRHFEDLSNQECAAVLGIAPKAASIRYVRALKRFQELINNSSLF